MYVTGHSLGGALANLAAHDVQQYLHADHVSAKVRVACYTFGPPRPGNHAFAKAMDAVVPDNWTIINDQVSRMQS